MNPNTPVGCPQCGGGQMDLWQAGRRLALTGLFASVTDWIEVDIYSCPACGRLAFFRTNFLPQPKKHVPVEPEPTDVDTAAFYVPGTGELVKCPVCGKEHPRDDAVCPPVRDPAGSALPLVRKMVSGSTAGLSLVRPRPR